MSAGVGNLIQANDYNTIQSTIAGVLGQNANGYGQTVTSGQVATNGKITVAQWNALQNDITAVNYHQLNTAPLYSGQPLTTASTTVKIREADRAAYLAVAQALANSSTSTVGSVAYPGSFVVAPTGQNTTPSVSGVPWVSTRSANWGGVSNTYAPHGVTPSGQTPLVSESNEPTIQHQIQLQWSTIANAEYFFNAGGSVIVSAGLSPSVTNSKNTTWSTLLSNMGTIRFSYYGTVSLNSYGTGTSYGWAYMLANPGVNVTIYTAALSGGYAPGQYDIVCNYNSGVLQFNAQFRDLESSSGYQIQEDITGTTTSTFNLTYASGSSVSSSAYLPTASLLIALSS
jgi:hypothetical protein